jgi:hypothetical protein
MEHESALYFSLEPSLVAERDSQTQAGNKQEQAVVRSLSGNKQEEAAVRSLSGALKQP